MLRKLLKNNINDVHKNLLNRCKGKNFSYSKIKVIMVEDYPSIGFEGEIVEVKPKYAKDFLIPNKIAVYNFPGVYNRLFPSLDEEELSKKKEEKAFDKLLAKLDESVIVIKKNPSIINKMVLREAQTFQEICELVEQRYKIIMSPENIKLDSEIIKFGYHQVPIMDCRHQGFGDRKIDFTLIVEIVNFDEK